MQEWALGLSQGLGRECQARPASKISSITTSRQMAESRWHAKCSVPTIRRCHPRSLRSTNTTQKTQSAAVVASDTREVFGSALLIVRNTMSAVSARVCTGTGLTPATSAPGLGSPLPHLRRDWTPHLRRDLLQAQQDLLRFKRDLERAHDEQAHALQASPHANTGPHPPTTGRFGPTRGEQWQSSLIAAARPLHCKDGAGDRERCDDGDAAAFHVACPVLLV